MSEKVMWGIAAGCVLLSLCVCLGFWSRTRRKYVRLASGLLDSVRQIEEGVPLLENLNEDTLEGKIQTELVKLSKVYRHAASTSMSRKKEVQQVVSDISHQLKTPIANLLMYNDMVLDRKMPEEEAEQYLLIMKEQVEKLDFLVKALVKMSRVESAMIVLSQKQENLYQCLAQAVAGISAEAGRKGLHVDMACEEESSVWIDRKWTVEAIGNVLDNAVKYTGEGGHIHICVQPLEVFTRVDIVDDGIGIEEQHYNDIFKRFWRDTKVHDKEGIGIGLYLTREIITRQGGYMKVSASPGEGSCFSIYLPSEQTKTL